MHDWRAPRWERLGIQKFLEQDVEAPAAPLCSDSGAAVGGGRAGGKSAAGAEAPPRPHGSPRVSTHSVVAFALVPRMVILCAPVTKFRIFWGRTSYKITEDVASPSYDFSSVHRLAFPLSKGKGNVSNPSRGSNLAFEESIKFCKCVLAFH